MVSEPFDTLGRTRSETKREIEEKIENNVQGIFELKEWMIEMSKTIDLVAANVQNLMNLREEGSVLQSRTLPTSKEKETEEGESSHRRSGNEVDRSKYKRLEMPILSGENPDSWVYRAEHYFEIHELDDLEKIKVAIIAFAPDGVDWFRWTHNRRPILTWEALKERLFSLFRPAQEGMLLSQLLRIQQEGTYEEYLKKFGTYLAPLPNTVPAVSDWNVALKLAAEEMGSDRGLAQQGGLAKKTKRKILQSQP